MLERLAVVDFPTVAASHSSADSSLATIAVVPDFHEEEGTCAFGDDEADS